MTSFVKELSQQDKEYLKDVLNHKGMNIILQWIAGRAITLPKIAMQDTSYEEVQKLRGEFFAYQNIAVFIKDTQEEFNNS